MIAMFAAALLAAQTAPTEPEWTWTLYANDAPVVLAHEVPDTANLRVTLECDPGSSVARVTLYGGEAMTGMARVASGDASAVAEAATPRTGTSRLALRVDHPVFAAFIVDGRMTVAAGDQDRSIEVPSAHLAKLRRFAVLCSG